MSTTGIIYEIPQYQPPFLLGVGGNLLSQISERWESEKNECLGGLKRVPVMDICLGGAYYVSSEKKTF